MDIHLSTVPNMSKMYHIHINIQDLHLELGPVGWKGDWNIFSYLVSGRQSF